MLPNLIIIGAQKAGTSSLHYYLSQHPEIFMSQHKELNFFNEGFNYKKGQGWYESQFPEGCRIQGEASPLYTRFPSEMGVPARMHAMVPEAKLIYILRDPIERLISAYCDSFRGYTETRSFDEAMASFDDNEYVDSSRYAMQLKQFLAYYPMSQILVLTAETLRHDRQGALKRIFRFLGVDEGFQCEAFSELKNVSEKKVRSYAKKKPSRLVRYFLSDRVGASFLRSVFSDKFVQGLRASLEVGKPVERPELSEDLYAKLVAEFQGEVDELKKLTGCSFEEWTFQKTGDE